MTALAEKLASSAHFLVPPLIVWFRSNRRELPWRIQPSPYRIWVSELMLQQTQVVTVIPYFDRFIARFPNIASLAAADLEDVLKLWEGLGYYSRARRLHEAARQLTEARRELPHTYADLLRLPGVGPYTAAAIASIAFGEPVAVVDGNVARLFSRVWAITTSIDTPVMRRDLRDRLQLLLDGVAPAEFNEAVMELGALVCRPRNPDCDNCPLRDQCIARRDGLTHDLPRRRKRADVPLRRLVAAVVHSEGEVLIAKRAPDAMLGGLWHFPDATSTSNAALETILPGLFYERLGVSVTAGRSYRCIRHAYSHFKIDLTGVDCTLSTTRAVVKCDLAGADSIRWVTVAQCERLPFDRASLRLIDQIKQRHHQNSS